MDIDSWIIVPLFVIGGVALAAAGLFAGLWFFALYEKGGPPLLLPLLMTPKRYRLELSLWARLLGRAGDGPGERYRVWARRCLLVFAASGVAFITTVLLQQVVTD